MKIGRGFETGSGVEVGVDMGGGIEKVGDVETGREITEVSCAQRQ